MEFIAATSKKTLPPLCNVHVIPTQKLCNCIFEQTEYKTTHESSSRCPRIIIIDVSSKSNKNPSTLHNISFFLDFCPVFLKTGH